MFELFFKNRKNAIESLKLFNEKAEKLNNLSFVTTFFSEPTKCTIRYQAKDDNTGIMAHGRSGPSDESIDAFVLTIRFFLQDNEKCSFRNLATIYDENLSNTELRKEFHTIRNKLNIALDSNAGIAININDIEFNQRKILDTIIYGSLSHSNTEKKKVYDLIKNTPLLSMFEFQFINTLGMLFRAISIITNINYKAIQYLENFKY